MAIQPVSPPPLPERVIIGVLALQGAFIEHIHYLQRLRPKNHTITAIPIRSTADLATCDGLVIPGGESTVIASVASHTPGMLEALLDFVRDPSKPVWGTCAGMILMAEQDGIGGGKKPQEGWGGIDGLRVWRNLFGGQLESFESPLLIPELSEPTKPFNAIFIRAPAVHSLRPTKASVVDLSIPSPSSSNSPSPIHSPLPEALTRRRKSSVGNLPLTPSPLSQTTLLSDGTEVAAQPNGVVARPRTIEIIASLPPNHIPPPPPSTSHLGTPALEDTGKVMIRQGRKMVTSFHPELSGDHRIHEYWVNKCVLGL